MLFVPLAETEARFFDINVERIMRAEQRHRRDSAQNGQPCSDEKLSVLLARELDYHSRQNIRHLRRRWVFGLLTFLAAVLTTAEVTNGSKFAFFDTLLIKTNPSVLKETIEDHRHIQVAELAMFNSQHTGGFSTDRPSMLDPSLYRHRYLLDAVWRPSPTRIFYMGTALSLEARRAVEFSPLAEYSAEKYAPIEKNTANLQPKAIRIVDKRRTKLLAADETPQDPTAPSKGRRQCNDQNGLCGRLDETMQKGCVESFDASICVKHNYRTLERNAAALDLQKYRR